VRGNFWREIPAAEFRGNSADTSAALDHSLKPTNSLLFANMAASASDLAKAGTTKYSKADSFNLPTLKRGCYKEALQLFNQALSAFGEKGNFSDRTGVMRNAGW
jgi:hypothetical protein